MISPLKILRTLPPPLAPHAPAFAFATIFLVYFLSYIEATTAFGTMTFSGYNLVVGQTIPSLSFMGEPLGRTGRMWDPVATGVLVTAAAGVAVGTIPRIKGRIGAGRFLVQTVLAILAVGIMTLQWYSKPAQRGYGGSLSLGGAFWLAGIAHASAAIFAATLFKHRSAFVYGPKTASVTTAESAPGTARMIEALGDQVGQIATVLRKRITTALESDAPPKIYDIHLWDGKEWVGPYDMTRLREWLLAGKISSETYVCRISHEPVPLRDLLAAPSPSMSEAQPSGNSPAPHGILPESEAGAPPSADGPHRTSIAINIDDRSPGNVGGPQS